jgi:hypothetical protein
MDHEISVHLRRSILLVADISRAVCGGGGTPLRVADIVCMALQGEKISNSRLSVL